MLRPVAPIPDVAQHLRRFGIAADRGRLVRESVAVLLADLDVRGEASVLARRIAGAQPGGNTAQGNGAGGPRADTYGAAGARTDPPGNGTAVGGLTSRPVTGEV